jgi:hypothetical protein
VNVADFDILAANASDFCLRAGFSVTDHEQIPDRFPDGGIGRESE